MHKFALFSSVVPKCKKILRYLILLISETLVLLGISAFVIFYEPMGSVIVILFFGLFETLADI